MSSIGRVVPRLLAGVVLLAGCQDDVPHPTDPGAPDGPEAPGPVAFGLGGMPSDPARSGTYCGCATRLQEPNFGVWSAPMYVPQSAQGGCPWELGQDTVRYGGPQCSGGGPAEGLHPVALIYNAWGFGNSNEDYAELGLHLASHGFVVVSLDASIGLGTALNVLGSAIEFDNKLSEDVVLIGHSSGGGLMVERAPDVLSVGGNIAAMVLLAPTTSMTVDYSLPDVEAFLGLHWVGDNDSGTYGALAPGGRRSVFRIYDQAGFLWDKPNQLTLDKSFVFFDWAGHYKQDQVGLIAYTTAFLRRYAYDETAQDTYLKHMNPIAGLAASQLPVSQQYAVKDKIAAANFEEWRSFDPPNFDHVFVQGGYGSLWPSASDDFFPHATGALLATLSDARSNKAINVLLEPYLDVSSARYLSFRISQRYHPVRWPTGSDVEFRIEIQTSGEHASVAASDYQVLTFPEVQTVVVSPGGHQDDATKNAMRTYVIPLDDFAIQDWSDVGAVVFDFSDTPGELSMTLDDVEFIP